MGSSTEYGEGQWGVYLPIEIGGPTRIAIFSALFKNVAGGSIDLYQGLAYTDGPIYVSLISDRGSTASVAVDSNTPFAWGEGDSLIFSGSYESV